MKISDNLGNEYKIQKNGDLYTISREDIPEGIDYIDIVDENLFARSGEEGYFVIADTDAKGSSLCKFNEKENGERIYKQNLMPIFGVKKKGISVLGIATGYKEEFYLVFGVKDGSYYIYSRFMLNGMKPYEDISLRLVMLPVGSSYSEMAVYYRNYRLENKKIQPLSEKIKERRAVEYAVNSPEIRIRMGWKPAPPAVLEQTEENEPEMKVACTFDRIKELIDELKRQGVDKAELCLVGWNKSGHDGRWPQIFPVEEKLGGEKKLRELISYAQSSGYQIVCHTNSTECYNIANSFSYDITVKDKNGESVVNALAWSGGKAYDLCPVKAYEYAKKELPKISELGFSGLHYIDVISVVPLRWCFDKKHPVNPKESLELYRKIMKLSRDTFGGFASEGVFDFCADMLDYGLYISWPETENKMVDCKIPLWAICYHGIILYNPTTDTVNYPIKKKEYELEVLEYGARPSFYLYSRFLEGSNQDDWLGKVDFECGTDEELKYTVSKIKEAYDNYKELAYLQTEFIEKHEQTAEGVFRTIYSDGSVITVDYNNKSYNLTKA